MRWLSIFNLSCDDDIEFFLTDMTIMISISTSNEFLNFSLTNCLSKLLSDSSKVFDGDVACAFIIEESEYLADIGSRVFIRNLFGEKIEPFLEVDGSTSI